VSQGKQSSARAAPKKAALVSCLTNSPGGGELRWGKRRSQAVMSLASDNARGRHLEAKSLLSLCYIKIHPWIAKVK